MARNCFALALWMVFLVSLGGCSSLLSQKKETVKVPTILEEDVPDKPNDGRESPLSDQGPAAPGAQTVPPGLSSQPMPQSDPATRPPRRFERKDKKWRW
jgi:hypothetical protein